MKMAIITAHAGADSLEEATKSWVGRGYTWEPFGDSKGILCPGVDLIITNGSEGMLPAYQYGFEFAKNAGFDLLAYLHDDVIIDDDNGAWIARVEKEFEDPTVGLVGFGGAIGHGSAGMYDVPYQYQLLARHAFMSNMRDAENHGTRFIRSCNVAVLDGFAMIVRREVLEKAGGWPLGTPIGYVCYDYWLSCMTRRLGYKIRLVGVPCQHLGGRTFVKLGKGDDPRHWQQYLDSHKYIYEEFRDVLPFEATQ